MIEKITKKKISSKKISDDELLKAKNPAMFIWVFIKSYFLLNIFLICFFVACAQSLEMIAPIIFGQIIDGIKNDILTKEITLSPTTLKYILILLGLNIGWRVLYRVYDLVDYATIPYIRMIVQQRMFEYSIHHSSKFFHENFAGKIAQKIRQASLSSYYFASNMMVDLSRALIVITTSIYILSKSSFLLIYIIITFMVVFISVSYKLSKKNIELSKNYSESVSVTSGKTIDSLSNYDLIRSFSAHNIEKELINSQLTNEKDASLKLRMYVIKVRTFQAVVSGLFIMAICYISSMLALHKEISIGVFATNFLVSIVIVNHIQNISEKLSDIFEHYGALLDSISVIIKPRDMLMVDKSYGEEFTQNKLDDYAIEFNNVDFKYSQTSDKKIINNLSFNIKKNEKIGLVGLSGSGKSTIIKLIKRQYDITSGTLKINGQKIRDLSLDDLAYYVCEVPQNPMLFHRSIKNNIYYGSPDYNEQCDKLFYNLTEEIKSKIFKAAQDAHCVEFIKNKDNGFDALVGEQGVKLSGGERQRIAIARAFLRDSEILLLDEATSALDSESEHHIQDALFKLMNDRTVIAIAHRLSTIVKMDRILVIENGTIIQEGTHNDLINSEGKYKVLWEMQSKLTDSNQDEILQNEDIIL